MGNTNNQTMRGAQISVSVDKPQYMAGETVRGHVNCVVTELRVKASRMVVNLRGQVQTAVHQHNTGTSDAHHDDDDIATTYYDSHDFLKSEAVLAEFDASVPVPLGHYQFPFSFALPTDAQSSVAVEGGYESYARVRYTAGVELHRPGFMKGALVHRVEIDVLAVPPALVTAAEAQRLHVTQCCCPAGSLTVGARMDKQAYRGGELVTALLDLKNDTTLAVAGLEATVHERVSWSARGHSNSSEAQVGPRAWDTRAGARARPNGGGFGAGFDPDTAPPLQLAVRLPPEIPHSSLELPTVAVRQTLRVKVRMDGCCVGESRPDVCCNCCAPPRLDVPVTLYRLPSSSSAPQPQAMAKAPDDDVPLASVVPYRPNEAWQGSARKLLPGGGGGGDVAAAVPLAPLAVDDDGAKGGAGAAAAPSAPPKPPSPLAPPSPLPAAAPSAPPI